jgi:hypothetical protein
MALLKPKAGFTIIDPNTFRILPADGAEVELTYYYIKRILDGDVELVTTTTVKQEVAVIETSTDILIPTTDATDITNPPV